MALSQVEMGILSVTPESPLGLSIRNTLTSKKMEIIMVAATIIMSIIKGERPWN